MLAGRGTGSGGKQLGRKAAKSPEERSLSHKSRDGASERRFRGLWSSRFGDHAAATVTKARLSALRLPSSFEGREPKAQLARRRGTRARGCLKSELEI